LDDHTWADGVKGRCHGARLDLDEDGLTEIRERVGGGLAGVGAATRNRAAFRGLCDSGSGAVHVTHPAQRGSGSGARPCLALFWH